jgi:hypothetical protein
MTHDWELIVLQCTFDEVARATNPSGKVDAVLVERNGGATTSFGYNIYVGDSASRNLNTPARLA